MCHKIRVSYIFTMPGADELRAERSMLVRGIAACLRRSSG